MIPQVSPPKVTSPVLDTGEQLSRYWQNWLSKLWQAAEVLTLRLFVRNVIPLVEDTLITDLMSGSYLLCSGTHMHALPDPTARVGFYFYFFNDDVGVTTIDGTINGDPLGYALTNLYQFVEVMSDGIQWIVTAKN